MKDRFKFRVWDKENKCLHYPTRYSNFAIVNGTVIKIESYPTKNSAYLGKRIAWEFDDAVIMQSTGLKDKNGKLIYEGDIVKTIYTKPDGVIINRKCVIEYNRSAFWINYGIAASYLYNDDCIYEVIGNIYENKELLK